MMKLVTLNTWGGRAGWSLLHSFFKKYGDTDVFCLQEIWHAENGSLLEADDPKIVIDLLDRIAAELPEFNYFFRPQYRGIYGLAIFVRKSIEVEAEGERFVFKHQGYENPAAIGNHGRNIQYVNLKIGSNRVTVVNFHGLWNGQGKSDSDDRLLQSSRISQFLQGLDRPFVLAGDFNLNPNTKNFGILKEVCPTDFVQECGITSTRSSLYPKPGKFADYILTCGRVGASHFEVLPDEVSDHLALAVRLSF